MKNFVCSLKKVAFVGTLALGLTLFGGQANVDASSIIPEKAPIKTGNPQAKDSSIKSEKKGALISIGLGGSLLSPILGDVEVDVVGKKEVETTNGSLKTGGVVQADIKDSPLLGNTHVGVAEATEIVTDDYEYSHSALVNADIRDSIVGDAHVGVAEKERTETDDYIWEKQGLVNLEVGLLGLDTGVAQTENYERKDSNGKDEDPKGEDPNGEDPNGEDPNGEDPNGEDPKGEDPKKPGEPAEPGDSDDTNGEDGTPAPGAGNDGGETLPKTGSFLDSSLLLIVSILTMLIGFATRKLNITRA